MSFISDNVGYFVVGLFLVLAALDSYSLCRPRVRDGIRVVQP